MKKQFAVFLLRWALNALGLWVAARLLGSGRIDYEIEAGFWGFLFAGLIFSLVNTILKPIVMILSLPAILVTLGLFTVVVNGLMVWLSLKLAPGISMTFTHSIFAGLIMSMVNYIVSSVIQLDFYKKEEV